MIPILRVPLNFFLNCSYVPSLIPVLKIFVLYVGPIPFFVVPICPDPLISSKAASASKCALVTKCALYHIN